MSEKSRQLTYLCVAELLGMTVWFSASAVVPQLTAEWGLSASQRSWMTTSVQIGFVVGALLSALLNLADRWPARLLFAGSAFFGAACNAAIPIFDVDPRTALLLRFLTGMAMAGVYPPGMKLVASWCKVDRGLGIGLLVGALTLGSAMPHLLNALPIFGAGGMPPWRVVLMVTSLQALLSGVIALFLVRPGPHLAAGAPFDWRVAGRGLSWRPTRLVNFGYLGHMWELYAMWAWAPIFLIVCYEQAGWSLSAARLAGFATVASGALGCVLGGAIADRIGRTTLTIASLVVSGLCCLAVGSAFGHPLAATAICVVWGFAIVADSAQFSAAVSELADPRYVGTALTVQTSLGFLLTLVSIQLVPVVAQQVGWERVFWMLAPGPVFGVWSMARLRGLPEAERLASGNR